MKRDMPCFIECLLPKLSIRPCRDRLGREAADTGPTALNVGFRDCLIGLMATGLGRKETDWFGIKCGEMRIFAPELNSAIAEKGSE
jgi:hypothetical protein